MDIEVSLALVGNFHDGGWCGYYRQAAVFAYPIDVTMAVCMRAGDLAERYRLRGYDSVHLASFLEIATRADAVQFSSFDADLNQAARKAARAGARRKSR